MRSSAGLAWTLEGWSGTSLAFLGVWLIMELCGFLMVFTMVSKAYTAHSAFAVGAQGAERPAFAEGGGGSSAQSGPRKAGGPAA